MWCVYRVRTTLDGNIGNSRVLNQIQNDPYISAQIDERNLFHFSEGVVLVVLLTVAPPQRPGRGEHRSRVRPFRRC